MASESNELTFVRCPSCRSLVPASASRCRICNNPLEASGGGAGGDASKGGGRVRQRTMSATPEQLLGVEGTAADSPPPPPPAPPVQAATGAPESAEDFDPLGAFLEDFEEPASTPPPPVASKPAEPDPLDLFGDEDLEPLPVAADATGHANHDELDPLGALMDEELIPEPAAPPQPEPPVQAPPVVERVVEKVVEPPPPPPKRETAPPPPPPKSAPPPQQQRGNQNNQSNQRHSHPGGNQDARSNKESKQNEGSGHERRDGHRHEKRADDGRKGSHSHPQPQHGGKHQERHGDRGHDRAHAQGGPKMGKVRPGRLFGWLVSFESPDGRAIELREGKFFVTGTSIRGTDLVVEDPSISTPHALMSVSGDGGLMIQDLMSDRGVFRRSGERGQYIREDGVFTLEHGDWVRFGDVEFLVTVVPSQK